MLPFMRFEVPQFIEVEDKIVGPLTWRQFIYLAGGIGVLILFYFSLPFILFVLFGLPFGALAGFLAFHRVNNRPFSIFLESFVNYMRKGKLYLWRKEHAQTIVSYSEKTPETTTVRGDKKRLSTLAEKLEFYSLEK
jgi:PrgI family protein